MKDYLISYTALPGLKGKFLFPKLQRLSPDYIERAVCDFFSEDYYSIRTKSRRANLVLCRYIVWLLQRRYTRLSLKAIGDRMERDHTTVLHGIASIENRMKHEDELREQIHFLEMKIQ